MSEVEVRYFTQDEAISQRPGYQSGNTVALYVYSRRGYDFEVEVAHLKDGRVMLFKVEVAHLKDGRVTLFKTIVGGDSNEGRFVDGLLTAQAKAIRLLTKDDA